MKKSLVLLMLCVQQMGYAYGDTYVVTSSPSTLTSSQAADVAGLLGLGAVAGTGARYVTQRNKQKALVQSAIENLAKDKRDPAREKIWQDAQNIKDLGPALYNELLNPTAFNKALIQRMEPSIKEDVNSAGVRSELAEKGVSFSDPKPEGSSGFFQGLRKIWRGGDISDADKEKLIDQYLKEYALQQHGATEDFIKKSLAGKAELI